jgi:hypothetical protein
MARFFLAMRLPLGAILLLAFAGTPASAVGDIFGFEPQYWNQSMDGTLRVDGDTLKGTSADLQDTLGLPEGNKFGAARLWLHWMQRNSLIFATDHSERSGETTLTAPLVFDDQSFLPGDNVSSHVDADLKSLLYGYEFLQLRLVKMGLRVGADRLHLKSTVDSGTTSTRAGGEGSSTFPAAGLGIAFEPIPLLRFVGEISGMAGSFGGDDLHVYDARVQAELYWSHYFGLLIGYRRVKIGADLQEFGAANIHQKGPYGGFVFRF